MVVAVVDSAFAAAVRDVAVVAPELVVVAAAALAGGCLAAVVVEIPASRQNRAVGAFVSCGALLFKFPPPTGVRVCAVVSLAWEEFSFWPKVV